MEPLGTAPAKATQNARPCAHVPCAVESETPFNSGRRILHLDGVHEKLQERPSTLSPQESSFAAIQSNAASCMTFDFAFGITGPHATRMS